MMMLAAAALFVGSQACRPCHLAIFESYARTPMARSSGKVDSVPAALFTAAGHRYKISENRLIFDEGSASFNYFIGSNTAGRTYATERDGFLFELPVTWYVKKQMWDTSPGYERETDVRLDRPIDPTCLACHASRLRPVLGTQNRYGDPPFLDDGVGCERCHGAGGEHVHNPAAAKMVNPAKLDAERRDSVCSQCHLTGAARIERAGRRFAEYRAGDRLSDFVSYFAPDSAELKVTSHVEKWAESGCKRASGDRLWCGTCHEPHSNANRTQAACLDCHMDAHHREEQCVTCHMPKSAATDIGHDVVTDHSIPRVSGRSTGGKKNGDLIAIFGISDDRSLGLAYAETGDARARDYLARAQPADAEVLLRLGVLERDPKRAASLYEAALRMDPAKPAALVNLGVLYAQAGRNGEAAALWRRALETNPSLEQPVVNLSRILPPAEARAVIERYLLFNPGSTAVRKLIPTTAPRAPGALSPRRD
jgi:tetratricopeptide (TPR) repeat protein